MFRITFFSTLLLCTLLGGPRAAAQTADSVWYMEWKRYYADVNGGRQDIPPLQIWFDNDRAYIPVDVANQVYFTIARDSVYMMDSFNKVFSVGPVTNVDMTWLTNQEMTWKRRRTPGVSFTPLQQGKSIMGITGWKTTATIRANASPVLQQVHLEMLLAQEEELPVPTPALLNMLTAYTISQTDFSVDYMEVIDTLKNRGMIPLMTVIAPQDPSKRDKFSLMTTELVRVERRAVEPGFFLPPPDHTGMILESPTEAERWMLTAIPMPGGPRKKTE